MQQQHAFWVEKQPDGYTGYTQDRGDRRSLRPITETFERVDEALERVERIAEVFKRGCWKPVFRTGTLPEWVETRAPVRNMGWLVEWED